MKKILILITILNLLLLNCSVKSQNKLNDLIGQDINSKVVQVFLNQLGENYTVKRFNNIYYYIYNSKGIDIVFTENDILQSIFLYSESSSDHRQYQDELPYNLKFTDTRKEVENKIGLPDKNGGDGYINYYCIWHDLGIDITYKNEDINDMNNKIHHITISNKKNN